VDHLSDKPHDVAQNLDFSRDFDASDDDSQYSRIAPAAVIAALVIFSPPEGLPRTMQTKTWTRTGT
jgi:hypothetical protein